MPLHLLKRKIQLLNILIVTHLLKDIEKVKKTICEQIKNSKWL